MENVGVRLTGDNSQFRRMLNDSAAAGAAFGTQLAGKTAGKLFELKDVSTAVATALGINIAAIADNLARMWTGMSKETEAAWKALGEVSDKVAAKNIENARALLTEEQRYQLNLQDRARIERDLAENTASNAKEILKQKQDELLLAEKVSQLQEFEIKRRDELRAKAEAYGKILMANSDGEYKARLSLMTAEDRIASLKETIAAAQAVITSGVLTEKNAQEINVQLNARKRDLMEEEAKLAAEIAENTKKNAAAAQESITKRAEDQRSTLSWTEQIKILKKEIAGWESAIAYQTAQGLDATDSIRKLDEKRAKLKDVEEKKSESLVEAAKILLKGSENLTGAERAKLEVLTGQVTAKERQAEIERLSAGLVGGTLTDAEKQRLSVLIEQTEELDKQLDKAAKVNQMIISISRKGTSYENQSTTALEGVRDRVKAQLDAVKQENASKPTSQRNPFIYSLQSEFDQITRELDARKNIGDYANRFGEDAARRQYGDSLTDRALRDIQDSGTRTANAITEINNRLAQSGLFNRT